jgi:hypothetical protein
MRRALAIATALALAAGSGGCFTAWVGTQASGKQQVWDERVRQERVPLPGIEESIDVSLPLARQYPPPPAPDPAQAGAAPQDGAAPPPAPAPAAPQAPLPLELRCDTAQRARDEVYRQAFRYDRRWRLITTAAFALEAVGATMLLLSAQDPVNMVYGGALAVDAVGTGIIRFLPRKEIYRKDVVDVSTPIRTDCPDGTVLEIGGEPYPVDAAGRVGELAEEALDQWMRAPVGTLRVRVRGWSAELPVRDEDRCAWNRSRGAAQACGSMFEAPAQAVSARLLVPVGALSSVD